MFESNTNTACHSYRPCAHVQLFHQVWYKYSKYLWIAKMKKAYNKCSCKYDPTVASVSLMVFHGVLLEETLFIISTTLFKIIRYKPCLDSILPSSVSNLRGDYHNLLPVKLVHKRKINLRRLVICWKTRWYLLGNYHVNGVVCIPMRFPLSASIDHFTRW